MKQVWYVATVNRKTGPIATSIVGESFEETRASCMGCAQLDNGCYAWSGLVKRGVNMVLSISQKAKDLKSVFERAPDKRAIRLGTLGDPARADPEPLLDEVRWARKQGASVLAYTHHWRGLGGRWKSVFMASCDDWEGAKLAVERGWFPTVVVPQGTPKVVHTSTGHTFLRCPAETAPGKVTCGQCRLCDPTRVSKTKWSGIMFVFHGPRAPWTPERRAKSAMRRLKLAEVQNTEVSS